MRKLVDVGSVKGNSDLTPSPVLSIRFLACWRDIKGGVSGTKVGESENV